MTATKDPLTALEEGHAFVNLSSWWKVGVQGTDASGWLNDLLTVELNGIAPRETRRSLLLTPTGRIRAAVGIMVFEDGYLLIQDPVQPTRIDALLEPYVLSSDVRLSDRTEDLELIAIPGGTSTYGGDAPLPSYSVLGPGTDVIAPQDSAPTVEALVEVTLEDVEAWRVRRGVARFGIDLTNDSLPHEVELGETIAYGKGCFLGQEAVARVRNLGHPPFVLLAADAEGRAATGEKIIADERDAGIITSAASAAPDASGQMAVIARIRWALKDAALRTASGAELRSRGLASAA